LKVSTLNTFLSVLLKTVIAFFLLLIVVDFRFRMLAFRGAGGEPHSYVSLLLVGTDQTASAFRTARLSRRSLAPCTPTNFLKDENEQYKSKAAIF
jgi:hypothetical protein